MAQRSQVPVALVIGDVSLGMFADIKLDPNSQQYILEFKSVSGVIWEMLILKRLSEIQLQLLETKPSTPCMPDTCSTELQPQPWVL